MKTLSEQQFVDWVQTVGLTLDPAYPEYAILCYPQASADSRFWEVPARPERRPYFLASLLDLMPAWESCYVWRASGSWPAPDEVRPDGANDVVELSILQGLGLPLGTADAVQFTHDQRAALLALLFSTTVFGWSVGQDLYVVPDHGRCFLETDHHDVVHATFRDSSDLASFVSAMETRSFELPQELPDSSFKRPDWIPPASL